ncbi:hypothetical protein [Pseudomonas syringae]|uniref:hypothetical protein n=1 Tax=Pseudomonas syringae TaxID=317 RepID=UPI001F2DBFB6|nr:hypothetical protein [Pseudomonas syringae]MCF5372014.1 hypothetical protein [Pseudomonas syringae]
MTTVPTDDQLAVAANRIVLASLPYPRDLMETMRLLDLPLLNDDGDVFGPAADNAAVFTKYGMDWTGLAGSCIKGKMRYWFIYRCELFQERAITCLGSQPSIVAAIIEAAMKVKADLKHWHADRKAA